MPFWLKCHLQSFSFVVARCNMWPGIHVHDVAGIIAHFGVADAVWQAFCGAVGDPGQDVRPLANMPPFLVAQSITAVRLETGRRLTALEAIQLGMIYRACHRRVHLSKGLSLEVWEDPDPWTTSSTSTTTTAGLGSPTSLTNSGRKLKFAQVIDQSDESEFLVEMETNKAKYYSKYLEKVGGLPADSEDPSIEQISAVIRKVVQHKQPPYCDFAVFVPFAKKHLRAQKYQSFVLQEDGTFLSKMVPGPENFAHWQASFRSYENHLHHDGDHHAEQPHAMGEHDRKDEQAIPIMLGIDSCSRRSSKRRIHGKDPSKNEDGVYPRRDTTNWVGRRTTLEPRVAEDPQGQGVLERPILRSSRDVDGKRFKGCTTHAHGGRSQCQLARWTTCTTRRDGGQPGDQRWGREENSQPSQERSQETEDGSRKRRAQDVEGRQWERRKGWRKQGWSKRQRWVWSTKRRRMLRMEQWEWLVWWSGSGRRLPGQSEASSQVHDLQIARSPESRMPTSQEELNYILKFVIVTAGGARGDAEERKEGKPVGIGGGRSSAPDRSGVRRNLDESKGTKRKRTTGDDPPGGDENPPPGRIHVDGEFLTFEEYLERRVFNFVHHYCGEHDRLSEEVERECKKQGIRVNTTSIDLEKGHDLTQREPYVHHLESARQGQIDGYHAGFPCNTYTVLRWRAAKYMPKPLRSKKWPYGFPSLNESQKQECNKGTIMMARSVEMCRTMHRADVGVKVPSFFTLENPPPSGHHEHVSAWHMDEVTGLLEEVDTWQSAFFNTCSYETDLEKGTRHWKPQLIGGTLPGIQTLRRSCPCEGRSHEPIVGKDRSKKSATYPWELCEVYSVLACRHFMRVARSEFLEGREKLLRDDIEHKKKKIKLFEEKTKTAEIETEKIMDTKEYKMGVGHLKSQASSSADLAWTPGDGKYGTLKETRKRSEVPDALIHVGGMRDPHKAVLGLPTVQTMGIKTWEAWMQFKDSHPEAITIAEQYGTENCEENEEVVMGWKAKLRSLWGGVELKAAVELESNDYRTPVEANLLEAWVKASGDPEKWVTRWLKEGTPLGIEERIETCGIFPPNEEETIAESSNMDTDAVMALNPKNYLSFEEAREDAEIEIKRYEERRYLKRIPKDKAKKEMKGGTVSRLGLIIKTKESGERKRRVVIDLRRSGGNGLSRLPEKLTLPRVVDAVRLMKDMRKLTTEEEEAQPTWSTEMAVIDVSDAFTVLPVKASEQKHCLSPSFSEKEMLCFQALLFGHKVAPLLYSRFAALIARMLAAGVSIARGGHQVYLDDSLWLFQGTLRERSEALAYVLNTMCALGIRVALGKGERARSVSWIGVKLTLIDASTLVLSLPEKFIAELRDMLEQWQGKGYASVKELRQVAGKTAWLSGVLVRTRWTTSVFYAVLTQSMKEEATKAADTRARPGLFAVKRLEMARQCTARARPSRRINLAQRKEVDIRLITDASPVALGGILMVNNKLLGAFSCNIVEHMASDLVTEYGSSSSQSVMEALAILVGLRRWKAKLQGYHVKVTVQGDSITALALTQKLAGRSSSPGLNFLGAELGICLEQLNIEELIPVHVPGKANTEADYLSRPSTWPTCKIPAGLAGAEIASEAGPTEGFYHLPTPKEAPTLWGVKGAEVGGTTVWEAVK